MTVPATLIRISTQQVLVRGLLPTSPENEVQGLDPDLEWLIDYEPFAPPLYDGRVFMLQTTLDITSEAHPDWPLYNQYKITYSTARRAVDDIKSHIVNAEREQVRRHVDYLDKLAILGLAVIFREVEGMQLNATETALKQRILRNATKIFTNHQRRKQLETEADQLQDLDIDAGWATPDEDEPV